MKQWISVPVCVLALGLSMTMGEVRADDPIKPSQVTAEHVGQEIAVEGRTAVNRKTQAGIHIYFGADTSSAFQALIPMSALHRFKVDPLKAFDKRNVRVTGEVEQELGKFFIRVTETKQMKVVPRKRRRRSN